MHTRAQRIDTEMIAAFSDGTTIFRGLVDNISKSGIKITDIPYTFRPMTHKYSSIVSSTDNRFKFMIMPVWFNQTGRKLEIGFKIVGPPAGWINFLNSKINEIAENSNLLDITTTSRGDARG